MVGVFSSETLLAGLLIWRDRYVWSAGYIVRNYEKDKRHANDVLFAGVLKDAFSKGIRDFNMGGSAGIGSLEFFKERWGAEKRPTWRLKWENPFWKMLMRPVRMARSGARSEKSHEVE
jgi:hypothetical protein